MNVPRTCTITLFGQLAICVSYMLPFENKLLRSSGYIPSMPTSPGVPPTFWWGRLPGDIRSGFFLAIPAVVPFFPRHFQRRRSECVIGVFLGTGDGGVQGLTVACVAALLLSLFSR
jgi:hypothetical protein